MTTQATIRKLKRSFTLAPESVAFVREVRRKRKARSDSEALDLLLREAILAQQCEAIGAAYTEYYDHATEEELTEDSNWAAMAARSGLLAGDTSEAEL
jgi:hypothetical protein